MHRRFVVLGVVFLLWGVWPTRAQDGPLAIAPVDSRTGTAYDLAWSPNGEWLAVGSGYEIMIFRQDLSAPPIVIDQGEIVNLVWSPDSSRLVSVGGYQTPEISIWVWDANSSTLELETTLDGNDPAIDAEQRSRHQYVAAWSSTNVVASMADDQVMHVQIWNPLAPEFVSGFDAPYTVPLRELVWSEDGSALIGAAQRPEEESYVLLSLDLEGDVNELLDLPAESGAFTLSPDQSQVAVVSVTGLVTILDTASGEERLRFQSVSEPVGLSWHPDGNRLAVLNYQVENQDNALEVWDISAVDDEE